MPGPLTGMKVVEMVGIGPAPFCGMLLADMGADVIRIDRPGAGDSMHMAQAPAPSEILNRGRQTIRLDLKHDTDREVALQLIAAADVLIEGFRPGVMERLGLGPEDCFARNPRLV